jgi:hypothetical protein
VEGADWGGATDLSELDREWILAFTTGGAGEASVSGMIGRKPQRPDPVLDREAEPGELWSPSREGVVWAWPRIQDRLVEELD